MDKVNCPLRFSYVNLNFLSKISISIGFSPNAQNSASRFLNYFQNIKEFHETIKLTLIYIKICIVIKRKSLKIDANFHKIGGFHLFFGGIFYKFARFGRLSTHRTPSNVDFQILLNYNPFCEKFEKNRKYFFKMSKFPLTFSTFHVSIDFRFIFYENCQSLVGNHNS